MTPSAALRISLALVPVFIATRLKTPRLLRLSLNLSLLTVFISYLRPALLTCRRIGPVVIPVKYIAAFRSVAILASLRLHVPAVVIGPGFCRARTGRIIFIPVLSPVKYISAIVRSFISGLLTIRVSPCVWPYLSWIIVGRTIVIIPVKYISPVIGPVITSLAIVDPGSYSLTACILAAALSPVKYICPVGVAIVPFIPVIPIKLSGGYIAVIVPLNLRPVKTNLVVAGFSSSRPVGIPESNRPYATRITFGIVAARAIYKYIVPVAIIVNDRGIVDDRSIPAPVDIVIVDMP